MLVTSGLIYFGKCRTIQWSIYLLVQVQQLQMWRLPVKCLLMWSLYAVVLLTAKQ